jgi:hypothetical protein
MIRVVRYQAQLAAVWDDFVSRARNGVFLFARGYMDYHADRFTDHSLLFFAEDKLIAVMPASLHGDVLSSHGGLTFGGVISDERMRTPLMLELFALLKDHLRSQGIRTVIYKAVPHIYHRVPAEEDLYALFVHGARLVRRDVSSTIRLGRRPEPSKGRRWSTKRALAQGIGVQASTDYRGFLVLEEEQLARKYGVRPTHTGAELELLAGRFPDNIQLFTATRGGALLGGVVVYRGGQVAHAQYIATSDEGRELGALDCLMDVLLNRDWGDVAYFDFGISTEKAGRYLNTGLIDNKESYGARAVAYDFYELDAAA